MAIHFEIVRTAVHHMHPTHTFRRLSHAIDHLAPQFGFSFAFQSLGRVLFLRSGFAIADLLSRQTENLFALRTDHHRGCTALDKMPPIYRVQEAHGMSISRLVSVPGAG